VSDATARRRPSILCVDDDERLLAGLGRVLHARFNVTIANSGHQAIEALKDPGHFSVIVSDMRMPGIDGTQVLRHAAEIAPYTVRVLLTGQADLDDAIAAVNEGHIFRFLTKPCSPKTLMDGLTAAVEQHRLLIGERVLLERTLHGSIKTLTDILALAYPAAFGRATRARTAVVELTKHFDVKNRWIVEVAAMLSQIGCVTLPADTAAKVYDGQDLSFAEQALVGRLPAIAAELLANIPRLEPVIEILRYQQKQYDGGGTPSDDTRGEAIPWGARALKVALDYDVLVSQDVGLLAALQIMGDRAGWYDPVILDAFADVWASVWSGVQIVEVPLADVQPGMIFAEDVMTRTGALLVSHGQDVTPSLASRLRNLSADLLPLTPVKVMLPGSPRPTPEGAPLA